MKGIPDVRTLVKNCEFFQISPATCAIAMSGESPLQNTVVSSANMYSDPKWTEVGNSFVNTVASVGPSTVP